MGGNISQTSFTEQDNQAFSQRLSSQLAQLKHIIRQPTFGQMALCMGAELEMYLINDQAQCQMNNQSILSALDDPQFQPELNRYNLELNLSTQPLAGQPFLALQKELQDKLAFLQTVCAAQQTRAIPIGILPTLCVEQLGVANMTPLMRYQALVDQLSRRRGEPFNLRINGVESLNMQIDDVTAEGANTSFQVHMMVPHQQFANVFNAALLTLPLVIAISANSPALMGKLLWDETRVALFKQSLDVRKDAEFEWQQPARVSFGQGWVRRDAWELYAEVVSLFPPLLPVCCDESASDLPRLTELNLHMGTTWPWLRPVYSHTGNGHVRIEFRALPAGPSILDMVANAALSIGLAMGLASQIEDFTARLPFKLAEYNFYRAAQQGLDAKLLWPNGVTGVLEELPISDILQYVLPRAYQGLTMLGVDQLEQKRFLSIIEKRLQVGQTGARWQRQQLEVLRQQYPQQQALAQLVEQYAQWVQSGLPVSEWSIRHAG